MNWTPGRIVGTVKPAGAAAEVTPIPAGHSVPMPVPAPLVLAKPTITIQPQQPTPTGTVKPVANAPSTKQVPAAPLLGTVQPPPAGSGDKIAGTVNIAGSNKPAIDAEQLKQKAIAEIDRDVRIGRVRASQVGALGWRDCPLKRTNKRFLSRTVNSVVSHNKREALRHFHSSTRKLIELERGAEERGGRSGSSHHHRHRRRDDEDDGPDRKRRSAKEVHVIEDDEDLEEGEVRDDDE